ncbi:EpsG family protein [Mixta calida]|uniref:EpsG family protein n=1 Tax=Mixta calida TaxID=665913 RepID=UPI0028988535|nr:EpsG family protein [Mixta calida]MDU4289616.1 EpsG family protein [Mixta calida]
MFIYILFFGLLAALSFHKYDKKIFNIIIFALFIVAAFRADDVDRDYKTYVSIYEYIINGASYTIEPTFFLMSWVSNILLGTPSLIFITFALIGLYFKSKFIKDFSPYVFLSLLIYYSNFFFLHEMTQIRIGVASGIGFFALKYLILGNRKKFIYFVMFSCLFHFSMVVLLVALFFDRKKIDAKFSLSILSGLFFCYFLAFYQTNPVLLLRYIPIPVLQEKLTIYTYQTQQGMIEQVNIFSVLQLIKILVVIIIFTNAKRFSGNQPLILLAKLYSLSPICLVFLSAVPAFAIRLSELFSVAEFVLLPMLIKYCQQKRLATTIMITFSAIMLFINLFHNEIVHGYHI